MAEPIKELIPQETLEKLESMKPSKCYLCGGKEFWLREEWGKPEWVCSNCHPEVRED